MPLLVTPPANGPKVGDRMFESGAILTHSPSFFNLPATNARCLESILYRNMAKIPIQLMESKYHNSSKGPLPHLQYYSETFDSITYLDFLKSKVNLDENLRKDELILNNAMISLVREKLHLAVLFMIWRDQDNYDHITYQEISKHVPFISRWAYMRRERSRFLGDLGLQGLYSKEQVQHLLKDVTDTLALQLSNKDYFFGFENPTSIDAIISSQLMLLFFTDYENRASYTELCDERSLQLLLGYAHRMKEKFLHTNRITKNPSEVWLKPVAVAPDIKANDEQQQKEDEEARETQRSWLFVLGSIAFIVIFSGINYAPSIEDIDQYDDDD